MVEGIEEFKMLEGLKMLLLFKPYNFFNNSNPSN